MYKLVQDFFNLILCRAAVDLCGECLCTTVYTPTLFRNSML